MIESTAVAEAPFQLPADRINALDKSPRLLRLFKFYVSDANFSLRDRLGISILPEGAAEG